MFRPLWIAGFRAFGWKITGEWKGDTHKAVLVVAPHTSAWDIVVAMGTRSILRMRNTHYLGKKELFDGPFGWFFRITGGVPVDRSSRHNMVEEVAKVFAREDDFMVGMAPEGTRQRVDKLKTGFWHIAHTANVPIIMVGLDFGRKEVRFSEPFMPTDETADMQKAISFFRDVQGKDPSKDLRHL